MKSIKILLIGAVISVQVLVEAGSYTVTACYGPAMVHAWDSDGGYGRSNWGFVDTYVRIGKGDVYRDMEATISDTERTATITYRHRTLKFKKPNDEVIWQGNRCVQYFGNY